MYKQRDSLFLQKGTIRNTEGYTQYTYTGAGDSPKPMQYYFHKDHLGNVCAVWNAMTSEVVQRTIYYPSGVPYVGWIISTTYFFTNQYVTYKTGSGIGQHLYDLFEQ